MAVATSISTSISTKRKAAEELSSINPAKAIKVVAEKPPRDRDITTIAIPDDMETQIARVAASSRTPYEKRVWTALCQVPRGQFTTYGILSAHLGSSPRAVGNALRRNPFAPLVPCHRVVATGGALGGFKGAWPKNGEGITLDEKRLLLRAEGVKIDDRGRVVGSPFAGFV